LPKTFEPIVVLCVVIAGLLGSAIDLRTGRVPNVLTFGVAGIGLALAASGRWPVSLPAAALGLVIGLLMMLPGHVIGATGAGDVKLFAAMGTLLGPRGIALAFLYTALAGGAIAVTVAASRRCLAGTLERASALMRNGGSKVSEIEDATTNNRFAYAPAIALGTLIAALGL
jgi:prepilin peptidase CpaA